MKPHSLLSLAGLRSESPENIRERLYLETPPRLKHLKEENLRKNL